MSHGCAQIQRVRMRERQAHGRKCPQKEARCDFRNARRVNFGRKKATWGVSCKEETFTASRTDTSVSVSRFGGDVARAMRFEQPSP